MIPADEQIVSAEMTVIAIGVVECHYPCVPECTREHNWEQK